eukprot:5609184-Alexandrium_andersonii.AAC.1
MSASLVGSEMCIRDRCVCATRGSAAETAKPESGPVARAKQCCRELEANSCLLYTSDAADDM